MAFVKSGTGMFIPDGAADGQRPHSEPFMHALIEIKARIVANCFALGTEGKIYPSIDGTVQLGALNLVLVFRGAAGAAGSEREVSTVLIPSGLRIDFPHQSSKEAIDPETTSIRLEDTQCRRFIPEKGLRHARRAATHLEADVYLAAEIQAWFTAERCGDPRGPFIQIRGDLRLPFGLRARLMTGGGDGGPAAASWTPERDLVPPNRWIPLIERELTGGVGPEPSIWARLTDGRRAPLCPPRFLGRCVAMESLTQPRLGFAAGRRSRSGRFGFELQ